MKGISLHIAILRSKGKYHNKLSVQIWEDKMATAFSAGLVKLRFWSNSDLNNFFLRRAIVICFFLLERAFIGDQFTFHLRVIAFLKKKDIREPLRVIFKFFRTFILIRMFLHFRIFAYANQRDMLSGVRNSGTLSGVEKGLFGRIRSNIYHPFRNGWPKWSNLKMVLDQNFCAKIKVI